MIKITKKGSTNQKGFTMVELVLGVLLLSIVATPMMNLFADLTISSAEIASVPTAVSLGNELMEEIKGAKFDELSAKSNGNWSTALGINSGEVAATKTTFDDVDDFNGWSQNFGNSYPGYSATVSVSYVNAANLNTAVAIPNPVPSNWTPNYKRINVVVSHPNLSAPITISTLVTEVQSL